MAFENPPTLLNGDGSWVISYYIFGSDWINTYQALWVFEDIRSAWNYVYNNFSSFDPGPVSAIWEHNQPCYSGSGPKICSAYTWAGSGPWYIFISDSYIDYLNVVAHETGHMYMANANQWWYWSPDCWNHYMFVAGTMECAMAEGWADYFSMVVKNTPCWTFGLVACQGQPDITFYNLETHSRVDDPNSFSWGDGVEGRVAGALWDLYDSYNSNEDFDRMSEGFSSIARITLSRSSPVRTFGEFWSDWVGYYPDGMEQFLSGLVLWWNTIDENETVLQRYLPIVMKLP